MVVNISDIDRRQIMFVMTINREQFYSYAELSHCDVSITTTFLASSNLESTYIFPTYTHNIHLLPCAHTTIPFSHHLSGS